MATSIPSRISTLEAFIAIAVALIFDALSLIPFLNILIDVLAWFVFGIWLITNGVPPKMGYRITGTASLSFIIGFIPIVSWLPEITASIIFIILSIKAEEKREYLNAMGKTQATRVPSGEQSRPMGQPIPLRQAAAEPEPQTVTFNQQNLLGAEIEPGEEKKKSMVPEREPIEDSWNDAQARFNSLIGPRNQLQFGGKVKATPQYGGVTMVVGGKTMNLAGKGAEFGGKTIGGLTPQEPSHGDHENDNELGLAA
ncbi:MAG: hypothetical protein RJB39_251 [Candidatus Parcubacteria bacterium]|jgi:hypothetical protein